MAGGHEKQIHFTKSILNLVSYNNIHALLVKISILWMRDGDILLFLQGCQRYLSIVSTRHWAESSVIWFHKKIIFQIQAFWLGDSKICFDIRNQIAQVCEISFGKLVFTKSITTDDSTHYLI